jgi:hypothetical protein
MRLSLLLPVFSLLQSSITLVTRDYDAQKPFFFIVPGGMSMRVGWGFQTILNYLKPYRATFKAFYLDSEPRP